MSIPKHKYIMDFIADKDLFKAVSFASSMIRKGQSPRNAIRIAALYYQVDMSDVAHYVGQKGGRKRSEKND